MTAVTAGTATAWRAQGDVSSSAATYEEVQKALKAWPALRFRSYEVFLQGSYANATNIPGDSDVDVVVMLTESFTNDYRLLTPQQKAALQGGMSSASYTFARFRDDVEAALHSHFGSYRVSQKDKCLRVAGSGAILDADVVPTLQYRLHRSTSEYIEGVAIYSRRTGERIVNFPKEHIANGRTKHAATGLLFKPTVRQMKRLKLRAAEQGHLHGIDIPGYLLECLTYNVPNERFRSGDDSRLISTLDYLLNADLSAFVSVDEIHTLFGTDPGEWNPVNATAGLVAMTKALVGSPR